MREEFEYAEEANEERAAIERDACLAPAGETWSTMLRQEVALSRSTDRKVRILLRLRKESANLPVAPPGQDGGGRMDKIEEIPDSDNVSDTPQGVEAVENLKMNDRCGNVIENKGSVSDNSTEVLPRLEVPGGAYVVVLSPQEHNTMYKPGQNL